MTAQEIDSDCEAWLADQGADCDDEGGPDLQELAEWLAERNATLAEVQAALAAMPVALPPTDAEIEAMWRAAGETECPF
jgi:hypothetical protein